MRDIYPGYDSGQVHVLAGIKRLVERCQGDPGFRRELVDERGRQSELLLSLGLEIDPAELEPLLTPARTGEARRLDEIALARYPVLKLLIEWRRQSVQCLRGLFAEWESACTGRVHAWRSRQMQRVIDETGTYGRSTNFPLFAFELSKGCSVGCWFCGFSAEPFEGFFPYDHDNARLWWQILDVNRDTFGPASQNALCYHATEPFDNPDYLEFIRDFQANTGFCPQTTTAAPLRNVGWTRELLRLREESPAIWDRFSILSLSSLRRVQHEFTPYELRHAELLLLHKEGPHPLTSSGRARRRLQQVEHVPAAALGCDPAMQLMNPFTIACVCGFLVNMVDRSVKLISPCRATDRWPNGYRVHAAGAFRDAAEYRAFLERTVEEHMPEKLDWQAKVSFRQDLRYERQDDGFIVTSRACRHSLKGKPWSGALGDLIAKGESSAGEIITRVASEGVPLPEVMSMVQQLFDRGLFEEELGGEAPRTPDE